MVGSVITLMVKCYYIYGGYYNYGWFLLHLWWVLHLWLLFHLWVIHTVLLTPLWAHNNSRSSAVSIQVTFLLSLGSVKENAAESDRKDLTSELELMKKLRRHPHVIELWGCVTKSGSRVVIGLIPPSGTNELRLYEPMTTWTVPLLLTFRAHDGYHRVCPVWRLAGLPEEEPRPERHLLQGPGCEAQDQPDVTAADEVRGTGGWRDGIFEFKQGGQTQESSNSQAKNV